MMSGLFPYSRSLRLLVLVVAFAQSLSLAQAPPGSRITQPIDDGVRITLKGNVHPLAQPRYDQGAAPDDLPMERMLLVLQRGPEQESALRQLLDDQQVKSSPRFHQWLTPAQFGQQFGPADSDLQAVAGWLTTQGFEVAKISAGRTVIEFSGTAGLVRRVLGTEIHRFRVNGEDHWANTRDPQIPAALAPVVAGFASLNNFPRKPSYQSLGSFSRSKATGEVQPLFTFPNSCTGTGSATCTYLALGPTDFATIYNVLPLWNNGTDGTGQTIAVVAETNINLQDVADFRAMFGLPAKAPNIILNGPDPGITSTIEEREATLDVQWSGAVAKGATIDLVVSETTEATPGVDLSALYIIDNNLAPVLGVSYGGCEAAGAGVNLFYLTLWEQAAAEGITVSVASGDSGSAGCDNRLEAAQFGLAVSALASTPFNVAVGGTEFNDFSSVSTYWNQTNSSPFQNSAKSYIPEMAWNDGCASSGSLTGCAPPLNSALFTYGLDFSAGGGGPSSCVNPIGTFPAITCSGGGYAKPSWQSGTGVPSDGVRDIPDLSLFSDDGYIVDHNDSTFYVICQMDTNPVSGTSCDLSAPYTDFQGTGGTSAAAEAFAGIMALVTQAHGRQGNANYVLYPLAAQAGNTCVSNAAAVSNASCIFYDITAGSNSVMCQGGSPNCSNTNPASGEYGIMVSGSPASAAYLAGSGYDLATGLGSVNVANLVNNWTSNFTPSTTTLALSTSPVTNPITLTHGQPIDFTINVTSGGGTPAGDVSLIAQTGSSSSNVTGIGPFTLSGGSVSSSTNMLPGGTYNVTAHYAGNGTFAASDSSPGIPVTVGKESSLVTLSLNAPPAYNVTTVPYGSGCFLGMDVTNSSGLPCASPTTGLISYPCPTGALTVTPAPTDQNPPPGTVPGSYILNSQGYAEDQYIRQPLGEYKFVASYAGDNSYTASTSPPLSITIAQAPTTTTVGVQAPIVGSQVWVNINTQSSGVAPTGTVQLTKNGAPLGGGSISGTPGGPGGHIATGWWESVLALPSGPSNVTAQYSGDSNYAASSSGVVTITMTDFSLSANPSPVTISTPGQAGSSTISVAPLYGFSAAVNLSVASGCPPGATCTLSYTYLFVSGASAGTSTLTIATTAASSADEFRRGAVGATLMVAQGGRKGRPYYLALLWLLAGSLALAMLLGSSAMRRRPAALLLATALLAVGVWGACGGGGTSSPPAAPVASLSTTSLTFGSQNTGTSSAAQSVTLTNTGNATLSITSIGLTGTNSGDFSQTNTCGSGVAAGANCSINVTFTPTATGARSASVSISDNASGSPQTVNLTGTGVQSGTPAGTYPIIVNAVSGPDSHSITVNVVVQ